MTATDERGVESGYPHTLRPELHRALDAAGIDYWVAQGLTFWDCPDGRECVAYGYQVNGKPALAVKIVGITDPEQAIAATLGSFICTNSEQTSDEQAIATTLGCGKCHNEWHRFGQFKCSACGYTCLGISDGSVSFSEPRHCPNCGAEVCDGE